MVAEVARKFGPDFNFEEFEGVVEVEEVDEEDPEHRKRVRQVALHHLLVLQKGHHQQEKPVAAQPALGLVPNTLPAKGRSSAPGRGFPSRPGTAAAAQGTSPGTPEECPRTSARCGSGPSW